MMMKYNKEQILKNSNNGLAFFKSVIPNLKIDGDRSEKTYNPFYNDTNPSMSIYFSGDRWHYRDYGDEEYAGDVFHFMSHYFELDVVTHFWELLQKMGEMLEGLETDTAETPSINIKPSKPINRFYQLFKKDGPVTDHELEFVKKYGILKHELKYFQTSFIDGYKAEDKKGERYDVHRKEGQIMIAYEGDGYAKIYTPDPKKFTFLGNYPKDYVFGYQATNDVRMYDGEPDYQYQFIVGGEKDVLAMNGLGLSAFCFNSESSWIPETIASDIDKPTYVLYDADEHGKKASQSLADKYGFEQLYIPDELVEKGCKDVADCVAKGFDNDLYNHIVNIAEDYLVNIGSSEEEEVEEEIDEEDSIVVEDSGPIGVAHSNPTNTSSLKDSKSTESLTPKIPLTPITPTLSVQEINNHNELYPRFERNVYDLLPPVLIEILNDFENEQKDVLLLGTLGVVSSMLTTVVFKHRRKYYHPNLSIFITAPPASGKADLMFAKMLGAKIHDQFNEIFKIELDEFNLRDKEEPPVPAPQRKLFFIPGNSSSGAFITQMGINEGIGCLFETEGDTLSKTQSQDWGIGSDEMRKNSENEPISKLRVETKYTNVITEIDRPKMGIVMSGTPHQLFKLIPDPENGLFSRFIIYNFSTYHDEFNLLDDGIDLDSKIEDVSKRLLKMYNNLQKHETIVFKLTDKQRVILSEYFKSWDIEFSVIHGDYGKASIRRLAMSVIRIAVVLSALRKIDDDIIEDTIICEESDFAAALMIGLTIKMHIGNTFSNLDVPKKVKIEKTLKQKFLEQLPIDEEFNKQMSVDIGRELKIPKGTSEKYMSEFATKNLIVRKKRDCYIKYQ